jgi:thiol-disulfide isomerase/thioredoxin
VAKSPPTKRTPTKGSPKSAPVKGGRPAGLFTWLAIGLVVVVVVVLVIIKVTGGTTASTNSTGFQPADPTTVAEVTHIPTSVFNTVGVTSPVAQVTPPLVLKGQPALTAASGTAKKLPEVLYIGAEYCPYCAAQRWTTIAALGRFGTFTGLGDMTVPSTESPYAGIPTFTFLKATYKSKYLVFKSVEEFTNVVPAGARFYSKLQKPTASEQALFKKYDSPKFVPGLPSTSAESIPFITIGNRYLVVGASYTPATLANLSRSQIASGLSQPALPVTQAIITSANYQTATFCVITKNQPSSVCNSPGVLAAKKGMGIK